jgi:hypothetical protein
MDKGTAKAIAAIKRLRGDTVPPSKKADVTPSAGEPIIASEGPSKSTKPEPEFDREKLKRGAAAFAIRPCKRLATNL